MAYTQLDLTKPDQTSQNITTYSASIRTNDEAMLDQLITVGMMPGWDYSYTAGTADAPTTIFFTKKSNTNYKIRGTFTYGGDGVTTMMFEKTTDGTNYDKMKYDGYDTMTITYSGGLIQSYSWSAT